MKFNTKLQIIPALVALAWGGSASAAGFQLQNQNAAGTAVAFAGAAAVAEDASTIFFNPAGMTYLPMGHSISMAGTVLDRSVKFSDTGTSAAPVLNPLTGAPTGAFHPLGSNGGDGGNTSLIPAMYYAYAVTPQLRMGLGVSVTYGSETKYSDDFMGRFSGLSTSIHQVNVNPSVAYRFNDLLSLGFGLNYAKNTTEFKNNSTVTGAPLGVLKGDDTAWGYNFGAMFQPTKDTRIGVSYRSSLTFHLTGVQNAAAPLNLNRDITADLVTPASFSLALSQRVSERLELLADATQTKWSSVQTLRPVVAATGANAAAPIHYRFKDVWRVGLGGKYQYTDRWSLRAGVARDKSPVPNDESRTMTVPDSDRTWLAFGARWAMDSRTSIDMGYAHIFFKKASTARQVMTTNETAVLQTVRGDFKTSANLFSLQLNYNF